MPNSQNTRNIPLPKSWKRRVRSAMLQVISLAEYAAVYTRSWAVDSMNGRVRLKAENDRLLQELAQREEEIRIKDARMARVAPHRRPHYLPNERMAILELRAARGWSTEQTARSFQVTAATIASWTKRVDEEGPDALVQLLEPVNKFPDFVRYVVQRLRVLCPTLGKAKIAQILARAGLHLGVTTVGRILKEKPVPPPKPAQNTNATGRVVTSRYPNHVWLVDLTTVATGAGLWCSWLPFALPQRWPFCWWVGVIVDHFSRRSMGVAVFEGEPDAVSIRCFLARAILQAGRPPRHLISDKGKQFWPCTAYRSWCRRRGIRPRFGAVGKQGSIAVVERFILTMKQLLSALTVLPLRRLSMRRELAVVTDWYNEHRPHMTLGGKTPNEVYHNDYPANRRPRIEPREGWPRGSPCASPWALVAGRPGGRFSVKVDFHTGSRRRPVVSMKRAA